MGATQVSRGSRITDALRALRTSTPEILGAVVVNMEGIVIASLLPQEVDEELIGGMAASLLGVGERISADLMGSKMEQIYARSPKGYIVLNAISAITNRMLTHRTTSNLTASYLPVSWFTNRITMGVDFASDEQFEFNPKNDSTWYGGQLVYDLGVNVTRAVGG